MVGKPAIFQATAAAWPAAAANGWQFWMTILLSSGQFSGRGGSSSGLVLHHLSLFLSLAYLHHLQRLSFTVWLTVSLWLIPLPSPIFYFFVGRTSHTYPPPLPSPAFPPPPHPCLPLPATHTHTPFAHTSYLRLGTSHSLPFRDCIQKG